MRQDLTLISSVIDAESARSSAVATKAMAEDVITAGMLAGMVANS